MAEQAPSPPSATSTPAKRGTGAAVGKLSIAVLLCIGLLILFELSPLSPSSLGQLVPQQSTTSSPIAANNGFNCSLPERSPSSGFPQRSCKDTLNDLDATHNRRRAARQEIVANRGGAGYSPGMKAFFDLYEPEAVCMTEERGGSGQRYKAVGDGPKFLCGVDYIATEMDDCLVYSVGSNNQIDFERFSKKILNCSVFTFDPTLSSKFKGKQFADFRPWGFGADGEQVSITRQERSINFTSHSLEGAMALLHHTGKKIDILKIDCEGCEYVAVTEAFAAIAAGRLEIDQILVELHKKVPFSDLYKFFQAADQAKMRVFHKERNHWGCNGYSCLEYAFVSEAFLRRATAYALSCPVDS